MLAVRMASTGGVCGEEGKCARSASRSFACSAGALVSSLTAHDRRDEVVSWPCRVQVSSVVVDGDLVFARAEPPGAHSTEYTHRYQEQEELIEHIINRRPVNIVRRHFSEPA